MAKYSGRLANPPVVYALCSLRFPTVGVIEEDRAAEIHATLRSAYPFLLPQQVAEMPMMVPGGSTPSVTLRKSWFLYDRRRSSGFTVEPTGFSYRTAAYVDFDHFVTETLRGLIPVLQILKPALIERVGLRFVDLIEGGDGTDLDQYLEPPLQGYKPHIEGFKANVNQQLVLGKTAHGDLVFRCSRAHHSASLPIELMDPTINGLRVPRSDQETVFLDIDHFRDNADLDPDPVVLEALIRALQGSMSTVFKDAVTQFACERWNKA